MVNNLRYEIKMVLDNSQLGEIRSIVFNHSSVFGTTYPSRQVNNIYFDTFDRQCLTDHIDGVTTRNKFRFRWYGDTWQIVDGQFEIKKKIALLGNKTIYPFSGNIDLVTQDWRTVRSVLNSGTKDINAGTRVLLGTLQPTLINRYTREYYQSKGGLIRLTLDYEIRSFDQDFGFKPNLCYQNPSLCNLIVEFKAPKNGYQQLADVLAEFPQRCHRHSKYVIGMS